MPLHMAFHRLQLSEQTEFQRWSSWDYFKFFISEQVVVLDLLAEAMVEAIYEGKAKGYLLDAYPMNLEQVRYREVCFN